MKVKCPFRHDSQCVGCLRHCDNSYIEVNVQTTQLIQELEARRKCKDCDFIGFTMTFCKGCIWSKLTDNFKSKDDKGVER